MEPPQNSLWLIFNNCLKFEKLLICYFYYSNSTTYFDLNPVGLDRVFDELSKDIKFINFWSGYETPTNYFNNCYIIGIILPLNKTTCVTFIKHKTNTELSLQI